MLERLFGKPTTTVVGVHIPSEYMRSISNVVNKSGLTDELLLQRIIRLGLMADALERNENASLVVRKNGKDKEVTLDTDFPLDCLDSNPAVDANMIFEDLLKRSKKLGRSPQHLQRSGRATVSDAAAMIDQRFGKILTPEQKWKLDKIHNGVIVARGLKEVLPVANFLDIQIPGWTSDLLRPFVDVHGLVIKPFQAVFLDEQIFKDDYPDDERVHTGAHEVFHIVAENNLPRILNEVATDIYAEKSTGKSVGSRQSMGENLAAAYDIWNFVEDTVGEELAFSGYGETSVIRKTLGRNGEVLKRRFIDHPLHDAMRSRLGTMKNGVFIWDQVLDLIELKKATQASRILQL